MAAGFLRRWRMNLSEECCLRMRCPEEGVLNVHLHVKRVNVVHQIIDTEFVGAEEFPLGTTVHRHLSFPLSVTSDRPLSYFVDLVDALIIEEPDVCTCLKIAELILSHVSGTDLLGQRLEVNVNAKIDLLTHEEQEQEEQVPDLVAQMVDDELLHGSGRRGAPKRSAHQLMKCLRSFKADEEEEAAMSLIGDQECSICFDDLIILVLGGGGRGQDSGRKMRLTEMPCSHIFHSSCLARWLKTSDSCPLCRFPLITNNS